MAAKWVFLYGTPLLCARKGRTASRPSRRAVVSSPETARSQLVPSRFYLQSADRRPTMPCIRLPRKKTAS